MELGRCLVTAIKRDNLDIICVVLGADTKKIRTADSVKLIEYAFNNYKIINIQEKIEEEFEKWNKINAGRINIEKGIKNDIKVKLGEYNIKEYPIKENEKENIDIKFESNLQLIAPINKNMIIGNVLIYNNEELIESIEILTDESVDKKGIIDYIRMILQPIS